MIIKHWQGYGRVSAKKLWCDKRLLQVEVRGEHEYGLVRDDNYDVFNWLVKKFDKKRTSYTEIDHIDITNGYVDNPKCYTGQEEVATYNIYFRN